MADEAQLPDSALQAFLQGGSTPPDFTVICPMCGAENTPLEKACPKCGESLASVNPLASTGVWRDGKRLIMRLGAELPMRCLLSNEPAVKRVRKSWSWHTPWLFLLAASPLIYIIVALIVRKKASIDLPVSTRILQKNRKVTRVTVCVCLGGVVLTILGVFLPAAGSHFLSDVKLWMGLGGVIVLVVGALVGLILLNTLQPEKITNTHLWLKGVHPDYLAALPEWRG